MKFAFWLVLALASFPGVTLRGEDTNAAFDAANKLYEQAKYAEAAAAYEKLLQAGNPSPALFFNLGNAYFKAGQIGRAVVAFRRAEALNPRDPDIRANLQFARNQIQGPTLAATRWSHWFNKLTVDEWTLLASLALWLWLGLLAILQWRPALRSSLRGYLVGVGLIVVGLFACVTIAWHEHDTARTAIVVARDISVHLGPFEESQAAFAAHDGAELRVLDTKNEWLQVTTGPGRIGGVRRDQVVVGPAG